MPKFQVTVADEAGHKLYDEIIEASGPREACAKAAADAGTAQVAETVDYGANHVPGAVGGSFGVTAKTAAVPKAARIEDVINVTQQLHADLLTATAAKDPEVVHASIIAAVEGLLGCVRTLASELVKVELEGIDDHLPGGG